MNAIVAIDGAAGTGKSTLARRLATELGLPYLNTGQMYRALALSAARQEVDPDDAAGLETLARRLTFDLDRSLEPPSLLIDGSPPGAGLTSPEVESTVSRVARHPEVRAVLRDAQRRLIAEGAVVEGRDIGAVVAPDAEVKIYLEADTAERVSRRAAERTAEPDAVAGALARRDHADAETNPFVPAHDAVAIDTSEMDADEVFLAALAVARAALRA
jgi:cytidylate kinase